MTSPGIALVISDLGPGGAQRVVSVLAREWCRRGHATTVVTFDDSTHDHFAPPRGVRRMVVGGLRDSRSVVQAILANVGRVWRLRQALYRSHARIVISFVGVTNIVAVIASIGAPWTLIISERNDPTRQSLGHIWDRLRRFLYRHADIVTANSAVAITALGGFVPHGKLHLVRNPLDLQHFAPGASARQNTVLAVGRLVHQKAFDVLLDAFAAIASDYPDWRLRIAGEGPLRDNLSAQAARLNISDRVDWLGAVDDCAPLYRDATVFALPSRFEGVPNALLEAMASGCAVIVSDASSGPTEYVRSGETGLVVPADDHVALSDALRSLIEDPVLRSTFARTGRARVEENGIATIVDAWTKLFMAPETVR